MGLPSVWKALREEARNVVLSGSVDEEQRLIAEAVDGQANTLISYWWRKTFNLVLIQRIPRQLVKI